MGPKQVSLQFHARTFEMAGATPALVKAAVRLLEERERECGLTFPASVREWYLFGGFGLGPKVGCGPTGDTMVPVRGLGRAFSDWFPEHDDPAKPQRLDDFVRAGLLVVMLENQGVCTWAVKLDGSNDPAVVVEVDSRRSAASPSEVRWESCAGSFSTFMYCRAWDQGCCFTDMQVMAFAQDKALAPGDLELLQSHFSEGPRTHGHPGATNYRFFTGNSAILIWDGEDNEGRGGQADWWLTAPSDEALLDLLYRVWHCGSLRETLYANDPRSQGVLDRLKQR
jgi:hypothetical protein